MFARIAAFGLALGLASGGGSPASAVALSDVGPVVGRRATAPTGTAGAGEEARQDTAFTLPPAALEAYVGQYELRVNFVITIWRQGDELITQATGQPTIRIFPEARDQFSVPVLGARMSFQRGEDDEVTGFVLHQAGKNAPGKKTTATVPAFPEPPELPEELLDSYVGFYRFTPDVAVTIARDGDHLTAQATGDEPLVLRAETKVFFSTPDRDALLRFSVTPTGKVTGLSVGKDGRRMVGLKVR